MSECLFDSRQFVRRALLPLEALCSFREATEFPTMGDPARIEFQTVLSPNPFLDLLVGDELAHHTVLRDIPYFDYRSLANRLLSLVVVHNCSADRVAGPA